MGVSFNAEATSTIRQVESKSASRPCTLVVLAAGLGSRYGGTGPPKQLQPVGPNGETLLDYTLYDARRAGFSRFVLVIREEMAAAVDESVGQRLGAHLSLHYAFQNLDTGVTAALPQRRHKPWGTAQAVLAAREKVGDDPFAVANADDYYGAGAIAALAQALRQSRWPRLYHAVGYPLQHTLSPHGPVTRGYFELGDNHRVTDLVLTPGLRVDQQGRLVADSRQGRERTGSRNRAIPKEALASMNLWGFEPSVFSFLERALHDLVERVRGAAEAQDAELGLATVVLGALRAGEVEVEVHPTRDRWLGLTYRQDFDWVRQALRRLVDRGVYPEALWS